MSHLMLLMNAITFLAFYSNFTYAARMKGKGGVGNPIYEAYEQQVPLEEFQLGDAEAPNTIEDNVSLI